MEKKHILVCDDDEQTLQMITYALSLNPDYELIEAGTSEEVWKCLQERIPLPDLLILDLWLPDKDSDELIPIIRQDERLKHIPIILISAIVSVKPIAETLGVEDYLSKPFLLEELEYKVERLLCAKTHEITHSDL